MNISYLMQYISRSLHTIVRRYSRSGDPAGSFCGLVQAPDSFSDEEIFHSFVSFCPSPVPAGAPVLLSVKGQYSYALVAAPAFYLIIGPVRFAQPVYLRNHTDRTDAKKIAAVSVPVCQFDTFTSMILLACNLFREEPVREETLISLNCIEREPAPAIQEEYTKLLFKNRESGQIHNPYDQEVREFSSIESGDTEQLRQSLEEDYPGQIGTLASNPLRQAKNLAIVVITLASRAAIRGGLPSEAAFSVSDTCIQNIEKCRDVPSVIHLFRAAEYEYAGMVKKIREQKAGNPVRDGNPHIRKCKDYIFSHLHDKITVKELARFLGLNANYLSELFRKYEKISLTGYIRQEKIRLCRNMLTYSPYSYSEIAAYLGFSSQSHLGRYFKETVGMTMHQYRIKYGIKS